MNPDWHTHLSDVRLNKIRPYSPQLKGELSLALMPFARIHTISTILFAIEQNYEGPWNYQNGQYRVNCVWVREKNK